MTQARFALWLAGCAAVLGAVATVHPCRAQTFGGEWPQDQRTISLEARGVPLQQALSQIAEAARVNLVVQGDVLADAPNVTVDAKDAPLRELLAGVLSGIPVMATRAGDTVTVRAATKAELASRAAGGVSSTDATQGQTPQDDAAAAGAATRGKQDRVRWGEDIVIGENERVNNAVSFGGNITVEGEVVRDVVSAGGDIVISGRVGGNVVSAGGDIDLLPGAEVQGETVSAGGNVNVDAAATVHGQRVEFTGKRFEYWWREGPGRAWRSAFWGAAQVVKYALLFLFGLLLLGGTPQRLDALETTLGRTPVKATLYGLVVLLAVGVSSILLILTILGIPGALALGVLTFLAWYVGFAAVAKTIGARFPVPWLRQRPIAHLAAGVLFLFIASVVPWLGTIVSVIAGLAGLGAVVMTRFGPAAPGTPPGGSVRPPSTADQPIAGAGAMQPSGS